MDQTDPITTLLLEGVRTQVFPGAVLLVRQHGTIHFHQGIGLTSYLPNSPPVHFNISYDLASLTKPLATASAILLLIQDGLLDLDQSLDTILEEARGFPLGHVSVKALLCHRSGLPGWRAFYQSFAPPLPSDSPIPYERGQAFLKKILEEPLDQSSLQPSVYSDLGSITLGFVVERVGKQSLAEFCQSRIFHPVQAIPLGYGFLKEDGGKSRAIGEVAPTEKDPWRGRLLQGEVHDENAAALGGVAGHAGLFGTAEAVGQVTGAWLESFKGKPGLFNSQLVKQFVYAQPGTSWALGWDTPSQPSSSGQWFSPESFGHLGFTGTSIWIDPIRDLEVIFLSNRVHPTRNNDAIKAFRPLLHDAVIQHLSRSTG